VRRPRKTKLKHPVRRLYYASKISEYRFRKILWYFVQDRSATETALELGLSPNSIVAIFRALRIYFTEVGLFFDIYSGGDPREHVGDNESFELRLLAFHLGRVRDKRGLKSEWGQVDYHLAESYWRFHLAILMDQRPSEQVRAMMLSHLLEIIRICGPVGRKPVNRKAGLLAVMRQMDQRTLWLERNSRSFRAQRAELRAISAIHPSLVAAISWRRSFTEPGAVLNRSSRSPRPDSEERSPLGSPADSPPD